MCVTATMLISGRAEQNTSNSKVSKSDRVSIRVEDRVYISAKVRVGVNIRASNMTDICILVLGSRSGTELASRH